VKSTGFRNGGRRGRIRHTEACGPIMAPASAARRSRGYGVRTDANARTRKVEVTSDYSAGIKSVWGTKPWVSCVMTRNKHASS